MEKPTIYISVEIKSREYVSQILLAAHAVQSGYRVYIGSHAAIYALLSMKKKKAGIYLDKSVQPKVRMDWNRSHVDSYCVMDAELTPYYSAEFWESEFPSRIFPGTDELVDKFLVVGPEIAEVANRHYGDGNSKVIMTGWPRIDVWQGLGHLIFADEVQRIQKRYGDYLLFASSFGNIRDPLETQTTSVVPPNDTKTTKITAQLKNFRNFKKTIEIIRNWDNNVNFPTLIIRPHPSERVQIWQKELGPMKKTYVIQEESTTPWVLASSGVIHHRSSVAIEAYYSDKNVFALELGEKNPSEEVGLNVSKFLLDEKTCKSGFKLWNAAINYDFNPKILLNSIISGNQNSTSRILEVFKSLTVTTEPSHNRNRVLLSQINMRSIRRAAGLIRDEYYWKVGKINMNSQMHFIPGGLDKKHIQMVMKIDKDFRNVRYRRMTLNLWELDMQ